MDITAIIISVLVLGIVIYFIIGKPKIFSSNSSSDLGEKYHTLEDKYNTQRRERELELDGLLDKIAKKGIESLSSREKQRLDELSNKKN